MREGGSIEKKVPSQVCRHRRELEQIFKKGKVDLEHTEIGNLEPWKLQESGQTPERDTNTRDAWEWERVGHSNMARQKEDH